jgi:hypothetical protein
MTIEDNHEATRDALARIISQGADPSTPIVFDFFIDAADLATALRVVQALADLSAACKNQSFKF